ncbi:COX15/CtaA family protein [Oleisolibacter albus]|uniref:COX15/CtaA family protein n=1 Tax=Oleisolibacter albus TaxID=2171757 RepID=UPI000DF346B3
MTSIPTTHFAPAAAPAHRTIGYWLLACAGMVFAMAIIGAITRLTESGLSITEWKPITGAIPPLNEAQWLAEFEKYKRIPEYRLLNSGMSLAEFKHIFFWEWFHRLWGRLIGLVFFVPFLWFLATRRIDRALGWKLAGLFLLGGLQGFIGWFMVQSGLSERTDVSHYRLALHLGMALILYGLLLWVALGLLDPAPAGQRAAGAGALRRHGRIALALVALTAVWGAFVAGLDAGFAYNSWPLMNGHFAPPEMWTLEPAWINPLENTAAVQFVHRWLAILTAAVVLGLCWRMRRQPDLDDRSRAVALGLAAAVVLQVLLGISTLLLAVPVGLGAAHQGGAILLITLVILALHRIRRPVI